MLCAAPANCKGLRLPRPGFAPGAWLMESEIILRCVHELEPDIQKLKTRLAKRPQRQVHVVVKKSAGFVLTYWILLSFVVAIVVALSIKFSFSGDYFESYRSMAESRKISEFHNKLGRDLLMRQESRQRTG